MIYMPIWILYWFPFFLPINYIIKFVAINIVSRISKKVIGISDAYGITTEIKSLCFNVVSEIVGIAIFYVIETNTETNFYYGNYLGFCLLIFLCVITLNFFLNYIFSFRKTYLSKKQKIMLASSIVIVTAPYLFLLPSGFNY